MRHEIGRDLCGSRLGSPKRLETALDQSLRAVADKPADFSLLKFGKPGLNQGTVGRVRDIRSRVEKRAVKIKDDLPNAQGPLWPYLGTENEVPQPQVRSALGLVKRKPAACSPSA